MLSATECKSFVARCPANICLSIGRARKSQRFCIRRKRQTVNIALIREQQLGSRFGKHCLRNTWIRLSWLLALLVLFLVGILEGFALLVRQALAGLEHFLLFRELL